MTTIKLKNARIEASFDGETGSLLSLSEPDSGYTARFADTAGCIPCAGVGPLTASKVSAGDGVLTVIYENQSFHMERIWTLGENSFLRSYFIITKKDGGAWTADKIICCVMEAAADFREIFLHDDQTIWHVPLCFFLRGENAGLYCGLEYPWWDWHTDGKRTLNIGYEPNFHVAAGESFASEASFIGIAVYEHLYRSSHGPYPGAVKPRCFFTYKPGNGLVQHFKDGVIPEDAGIAEEKLDWGEVWAMQAYMESYLPRHDLPEEGFYVFLNSWWAYISSREAFDLPKTGHLQPLIAAGISDAMTMPIYYGHDYHPSHNPKYIRDMRIDPPGYPVWNGKPYEGEPDGYTEHFRADPVFEEYIANARETGITINTFVTPTAHFNKRPDWDVLNSDGSKQLLYGDIHACAGCSEYADFYCDMLLDMLDQYPPTDSLGFDGRWLNYNELGSDDIPVGELPCYSDKHGHPAGDDRYQSFINIRRTKARIRASRPTMLFEQYYGLKRGGNWMIDGYNSDENYYEAPGEEDNRFQNWHNECDRFRPAYMNWSCIYGGTPEAFRYSMISALSCSSHCGLTHGYAALRNFPECAEFFRKWREWAKENYAYLLRRRCLFGYPGDVPVDGSAHMTGDGGYLFLFAVTDDRAVCKIPFDRLIGLAPHEDMHYKITRIYPEEQLVGTAAYGGSFYYAVPHKAAELRAEILRVSPIETAEYISLMKQYPPYRLSGDEWVVPAF